MNSLLTWDSFDVARPLLLDVICKSTAIILLACVAAVAMKRDSASTRHLTWLLAIIAILVLPVASSTLPAWQILPHWNLSPSSPPHIATTSTSSDLAIPDPVSFPMTPFSDVADEPPVNETSIDQVVVSQTATLPTKMAPVSVSTSGTAAAKPKPMWTWSKIGGCLWVAGFIFLVLRLLVARLWIGKVTRRCETLPASSPIHDRIAECQKLLGIGLPVEVMLSNRQSVPFVWGIARHRLLLPIVAVNWDQARLNSVLMHELAHVKRRDTLTLLLAQLACALHWFNPLVWFAAWRMHVLRERACDDLVLAGGVRASTYAEHLLSIATGAPRANWIHACGLAMTRTSSLHFRLRSVLSENVRRRRVSRRALAAAIVLTCVIAIPLSMLQAATPVPEPLKPAEPQNQASVKGQLQPNDEEARKLFKSWQASSRADGKIPGAMIGKLKEMLLYFNKLNDGSELAKRFDKLLPQFDSEKDWSPEQAALLLDRVAQIHRIPIHNALNSENTLRVLEGFPMPDVLNQAAWGEVNESGLRAALYTGTRAKEYAMGTQLKASLLVHNSGDQTVWFVMPSWQQLVDTALNSDRKPIKVTALSWSTMARLNVFRLRPGEFCETATSGVKIGLEKTADWQNARVGSTIEAEQGTVVRFSPGEIDLQFSPTRVGTSKGSDSRFLQNPKDAQDLWKAFVTQRVKRLLPVPAGEADRKKLLQDLTLELFGFPATRAELDNFAAQSALNLETIVQQLTVERGHIPFHGKLKPGGHLFRTIPPSPVDQPRLVNRSGYYQLNGGRLTVSKNFAGDRFTNSGTITIDKSISHSFALADGWMTWQIAWVPDETTVWIADQNQLRKIDFSNPTDIREVSVQASELSAVPESIRQILDVSAEQITDNDPTKGGQDQKQGISLPPETERRLMWGEPVSGLRIAIVARPTPGQPRYPGSPGNLYLVAQNVSDQPLRLSDRNPDERERTIDISIDGEIMQGLGSSKPTFGNVILAPRRAVFARMYPDESLAKEGEPFSSMMVRNAIKDTWHSFRAKVEIRNAPQGAWTGSIYSGHTDGSDLALQPQPNNPKARELFKYWRHNTRLSGKFPGGLVNLLLASVKGFAKSNRGSVNAFESKFAPVIKRMDGSRDWAAGELVAILDEVAAIHTSPIRACLENGLQSDFKPGAPLPERFTKAPWGPALDSGLRMAWVLDRHSKQHPLGTPLKSRILLYNSGKTRVVFHARNWQQVRQSAVDINGKPIPIESTRWMTRGALTYYRLNPGHYTELYSAGIGVGRRDQASEDWKTARVGDWIAAKVADGVTLNSGAILLQDPLDRDDNRDGWWLEKIMARLKQELPIPDDVEERKHLAYRASMNLFGTPCGKDTLNDFANDNGPEALQNLAKSLAENALVVSEHGPIESAPNRFRVMPPDDKASDRVRTVTGPGYYQVRDKLRLSITSTPNKNNWINRANLLFFGSDGKQKSRHSFWLPNSSRAYAVAWDPSDTVLWTMRQKTFSKIDFTDPENVVTTDTKIKNLQPAIQKALEPMIGRSKTNIDSPPASSN